MTEHVATSARHARTVAYERQGGHCLACWAPMTPEVFDAHHRQRRSAFAGPTWCSCNIVALHPACHTIAPSSVHQRPEWAKGRGLIVPPWLDPRGVPVEIRWPWTGWVLLDCEGLAVSSEVAHPPHEDLFGDLGSGFGVADPPPMP